MKVLFLDIDGVLKEESYKAAFQDISAKIKLSQLREK